MANTTLTSPVNKDNITWKSEGQEGGPYHSRILHVPSESSGLTLGRGYDMKLKGSVKVKQELVLAGVSETDAAAVAKGAGLQGAKARQFIIDNKLTAFEITADQQEKLFNISYGELEKDTKRLATKDDVTKLYGTTDFDKLHPAIREVLIDMRFRGDYDGAARKLVQKAVVANDLAAMAKIMASRSDWKNVPLDRFNARKTLLENAVKAAKAK